MRRLHMSSITCELPKIKPIFSTGRKQDNGNEYELPCVVYKNFPPVEESHEYEEGKSASFISKVILK